MGQIRWKLSRLFNFLKGILNKKTSSQQNELFSIAFFSKYCLVIKAYFSIFSKHYERILIWIILGSNQMKIERDFQFLKSTRKEEKKLPKRFFLTASKNGGGSHKIWFFSILKLEKNINFSFFKGVGGGRPKNCFFW